MPYPPYDPAAPKKSPSLSVNSDLLRKARALEINLSKALEERLIELVRQEHAHRWKEENRAAIEAHNRFVDQHGLFNDLRRRR